MLQASKGATVDIHFRYLLDVIGSCAVPPDLWNPCVTDIRFSQRLRSVNLIPCIVASQYPKLYSPPSPPRWWHLTTKGSRSTADNISVNEGTWDSNTAQYTRQQQTKVVVSSRSGCFAVTTVLFMNMHTLRLKNGLQLLEDNQHPLPLITTWTRLLA